MKIYPLPVASQFRPSRQNHQAPPHNCPAWNAEVDFDHWLRGSQYVTDDPREADWFLFQPFWNFYYINNEWGQAGVPELQAEIDRLACDRMFTICEYDLRGYNVYDPHSMVVFSASRQEERERTVDIPLLCSAHIASPPRGRRQWRASFVGDLGKFWPRPEMAEALADREDVHIEDGHRGEPYFVDLMRDSWIGLAPRGHGGQSFRFYEAMQLGTVPLHVGTPDTRPFKQWIDWDAVSLYAARPEDINLDVPVDDLHAMGLMARSVWYNQLQYGRWCKYVVWELENGG